MKRRVIGDAALRAQLLQLLREFTEDVVPRSFFCSREDRVSMQGAKTLLEACGVVSAQPTVV